MLSNPLFREFVSKQVADVGDMVNSFPEYRELLNKRAVLRQRIQSSPGDASLEICDEENGIDAQLAEFEKTRPHARL